jgi:hypothetical protein
MGKIGWSVIHSSQCVKMMFVCIQSNLRPSHLPKPHAMPQNQTEKKRAKTPLMLRGISSHRALHIANNETYFPAQQYSNAKFASYLALVAM